jgi:oligopeptide transport system substrate-binding protein
LRILKLALPQSNLLIYLVNGAAVTSGKLPVTALGVKALDRLTLEVKLAYPTNHLLDLLGSPGFAGVPTQVIKQYGSAWTEPSHMVTSGAYQLAEHVVNGYVLAKKNRYYYGESQVKIAKVRYAAISEPTAAFATYQSEQLDFTSGIPIDQCARIKVEYPTELVTVQQEGIYYYDFNMLNPVLKNKLPLRQALSMAVDRQVLTH